MKLKIIVSFALILLSVLMVVGFVVYINSFDVRQGETDWEMPGRQPEPIPTSPPYEPPPFGPLGNL